LERLAVLVGEWLHEERGFTIEAVDEILGSDYAGQANRKNVSNKAAAKLQQAESKATPQRQARHLHQTPH